MHQPVCQPVINMYHKQVHQPCTNMYQTTCTQYVPYKSAANHVPSMYQSCFNYSSTMTHQNVPTTSTIHLMYVPTHQLLFSTMYPTCTSTKIPHQYHHPNMIFKFVIDLVYMMTYLQILST
jgi:hypothetical protein